jgi:hypothetical protein
MQRISESGLVTKTELKTHLGKNGMNSDGTAVDLVIKNLCDRNFLSVINPIGSTCFVLTKKGGKLLENM